jgi:hypothetical protein
LDGLCVEQRIVFESHLMRWTIASAAVRMSAIATNAARRPSLRRRYRGRPWRCAEVRPGKAVAVVGDGGVGLRSSAMGKRMIIKWHSAFYHL